MDEVSYNMFGYGNAQRIALALLNYPNWNNESADFVSHIMLLTGVPFSDLEPVARPFYRGEANSTNIQLVFERLAERVVAGDVVLVFLNCHGYTSRTDIWPFYYDQWNRLLCSGHLKDTFITMIIDACDSGSAIDDGAGGPLGTYYHNILCACRWHQLSFGVFAFSIIEGVASSNDTNGDGWISTAEIYDYAKAKADEWANQNAIESFPVCYYDMFNGNIPLIQRNSSASAEMPPLVSLVSPVNMTFYPNITPIALTVNKPMQWIGYSLDNDPNVTITESGATLVGLADGVHKLVLYAEDYFGVIGKSRVIYFRKGVQPTVSIAWALMTARGAVAFNASSSSIVDGFVSAYNWTFGDGSFGEGEIIVHTFPNLGRFTVTVNMSYVQSWNFDGTDVWIDLSSVTEKSVLVALPGDVNVDGKINLKDIFAVAKAYGAFLVNGQLVHSPQRSCCPHNLNCDINGDGTVDLKDYFTACKNFGKSW